MPKMMIPTDTASASGSSPREAPPKPTFVSRFLLCLESRILTLYDKLAPSSATSTEYLP